MNSIALEVIILILEFPGLYFSMQIPDDHVLVHLDSHFQVPPLHDIAKRNSRVFEGHVLGPLHHPVSQ